MDNIYTIKAVSRLTGVSELVIRAWETRYNAVEPERTETNRRMYSELDLQKIALLGKLTEKGHRIGAIANLSIEDLTKMLSVNVTSGLVSGQGEDKTEFSEIIKDAIQFVKSYDSKGLEKILFEASVNYSHPELMEKIIIPLMKKVGEFWRDGILRVSHEHLTSVVVRKFLSGLSDGYKINGKAPTMIVTTPQGQYHEVGALIGASYAAADGWKVIYLGPSLPAEEIATVAREKNAKSLYLSLVYPFDDPSLGSELQKLKECLPDSTVIFAAGNAVNAYENIFLGINAKIVQDSESLRKELLKLRNGDSKNE